MLLYLPIQFQVTYSKPSFKFKLGYVFHIMNITAKYPCGEWGEIQNYEQFYLQNLISVYYFFFETCESGYVQSLCWMWISFTTGANFPHRENISPHCYFQFDTATGIYHLTQLILILTLNNKIWIALHQSPSFSQSLVCYLISQGNVQASFRSTPGSFHFWK